VTTKRFAILLTLFAFTGATLGCSHASDSQPQVRDAAGNAPLDFKPGSHEDAVFERMLTFREKHREKFKQFVVSYAASNGNVRFPALAHMKRQIVNWFLMSEDDFAHLPGYMKVFTGTGPYRRLLAKPGFSYVAGSVYLPCKAARLHDDFETAFAYVGGWGAGKAGKAVDAGFQRSGTYDDYALFLLAQDFRQISKFPRFQCGQTVGFRFYAKSDRELVLWAKGRTTNGRVEEVEARLEHPASYGWPSNGGRASDGIVLKRMTTIGQADAEEHLPDGVAWDENGSYFGHYANDREPRVRWSHLDVGRVDANGRPIDIQPWGTQQSNMSFRTSMFNYPADARNVWYTCTACPDEANAIDLSPK